MLQLLLVKDNLAHLGAFLYLAGFLFRDQIMLRALVMGGDFIYIFYFLFGPDIPLWAGVFWSVVMVAVNGFMIFRIFLDRSVFAMTEEEQKLYSLLDGLTPGEFRRLVKAGEWRWANSPTVVTTQNEDLDRLYYLLDGGAEIAKDHTSFRVGSEVFIGEVAFLLKRPASASVTLDKGSRYVVWEISALRRLMLRAPSLAISFAAALNRDMAAKVARS